MQIEKLTMKSFKYDNTRGRKVVGVERSVTRHPCAAREASDVVVSRSIFRSRMSDGTIGSFLLAVFTPSTVAVRVAHSRQQPVAQIRTLLCSRSVGRVIWLCSCQYSRNINTLLTLLCCFPWRLQKLLSRDRVPEEARPHLAPCCAPTRLSPLTVFYSDESDVIKQRNLPNMIVESCGCALWELKYFSALHFI